MFSGLICDRSFVFRGAQNIYLSRTAEPLRKNSGEFHACHESQVRGLARGKGPDAALSPYLVERERERGRACRGMMVRLPARLRPDADEQKGHTAVSEGGHASTFLRVAAEADCDGRDRDGGDRKHPAGAKPERRGTAILPLYLSLPAAYCFSFRWAVMSLLVYSVVPLPAISGSAGGSETERESESDSLLTHVVLLKTSTCLWGPSRRGPPCSRSLNWSSVLC